jgi:hypothetical protein
MGRTNNLLAVGLFAGWALACGSGDPAAPAPSGQSILANTEAAAEGVAASSNAPVIENVLLSPKVPLPGTEIRAVVEASDSDGDALRYRYVWSHNGREVSSGDKAAVFLVDLKKGDRIEVSVTASDGRLESQPFIARSKTGNRAPVLSAVSLDPFGDVRAGEVIDATPHASDPDNDSLDFTYRWLVNDRKAGRDRSLDTSGLKRGDKVQVQVVADDGRDQSREVTSPVLMLGNSPPLITQLPAARFDDGTFQYTFVAKDPDGDRHLRFFLEKGPTGMRMDAIGGVLTWTPTPSQAGVHPIEVGVKDGKGEGTTFTFELTVNATAQAPAARSN